MRPSVFSQTCDRRTIGLYFCQIGGNLWKKKKLTVEERRLQRIAQLKARLQKEEARLADNERKKRTGQLVSWGVMVEEIFKSADEAGRQRLVESAKKHLKDRNLQRALEGFSRLGGMCL